jgi:hypothetical protein
VGAVQNGDKYAPQRQLRKHRRGLQLKSGDKCHSMPTEIDDDILAEMWYTSNKEKRVKLKNSANGSNSRRIGGDLYDYHG